MQRRELFGIAEWLAMLTHGRPTGSTDQVEKTLALYVTAD
jgi:hypothetical protein